MLARPWLSGAVTIPWDAKSQFYPQLAFLARSIAAGQSPFWSPSVFAGWPQIADPQSLIFSPPHLLLALSSAAPGFRAADAVSFAMLGAGGLGVILIFRDRGWHPAGALVAALAFSFGGSAAARLQHTGQIVSLAYLPIALWFLGRALRKGSAGYGIAAGLAAGLIALGRDQVALLSLFVLGGAVVAHWAEGPDRLAGLRASLRPLMWGALAGAALTAVPFLLTAQLAAESNRPVMDFISAGRGSLHPAHLLTLVFADLYGANDPTVDYWGPPSFPWGPTDLFLAQNMGQLYLGMIPVLALLVGGIARGRLFARGVRFFAVAAALILLYALGWYTPAFRLMFETLPGVALFRRPADATFVLCALVAILGGYCVHRLIGDPARTASAVIIACVAVLGAALAAGAFALAASVGTTAAAGGPIVLGLGLAAAAFVVLALGQRMGALAATLLIGAFMTADLAWNNGPNESTGLPPATYEALRPDTGNDTVAMIRSRLSATAAPDRRDRIELAGIGYHWPNLGLVHDVDHLFGHNPLRLDVFARATGVGDTIATPDQRTFAPAFPSYRSRLADLFGLRWIATGVPIEQIDRTLAAGDLPLVARTSEAFLYENPRALPRVLVTAQAQRADFARILKSGTWPDFDPRHTVLLAEDRPARTGPGASGAEGAGGAGGAARIVAYGHAEIDIAVDAPQGGFLVLNDVWHPWWRASVNGTATRILQANVLFRAVPVPPGASRVRFTFHPFSGAFTALRARLAGF